MKPQRKGQQLPQLTEAEISALLAARRQETFSKTACMRFKPGQLKRLRNYAHTVKEPISRVLDEALNKYFSGVAQDLMKEKTDKGEKE